MPNWCQNRLIVRGPSELIQSLFGNNKCTLQSLLPCPQELLDISSPAPKQFQEINIKKYGHADWYGWCVSNWGTKWDPGPFDGDIIQIKEKKSKKSKVSEFTCAFDSAWAPPVQAFETICEKYPELSLRLEYFESGCSFFGVAEGEGGSFSDDYREYSGLKDLREKLRELPCDLAQEELEFLDDEEEEESKISE